MKKLKFKALNIPGAQVLSREQLKAVKGGNTEENYCYLQLGCGNSPTGHIACKTGCTCKYTAGGTSGSCVLAEPEGTIEK